MKTILLIRHGENDYGKKRLAGRRSGVHLNHNGQIQAQQLANWLTHLKISKIYSSPMERAIETAEPLALAKGLPVEILPEVIEVNYGRLQGRTYSQLNRIKLWLEMRTSPLTVRFPEGDTFLETQQRGIQGIDIVLSNLENDQTAVCFTHADIVRLCLSHYLVMPLEAFQRLHIQPGSISTLMFSETGVSVPYVNLVEQPYWLEQTKRSKT